MRALAVDAGGTTCRVALVSDTDYVAVASGAANASSNLEEAAANITSGIHKLAHQVGVAPEVLVSEPAYLGVAGVLEPAIAERLRQRLPLAQAKIEDDRRSALVGALGDQDGFVAHCGTGSFFAAQKNHTQVFAGGWGAILDDTASAYWVGIRALRASLYVEDGLHNSSTLNQEIAEELGNAAAIVGFANTATVSEIARFAQKVTQHANANDSLAINILQQAALQIAHMLEQMGWSEGQTVCLTGGIGKHYREYLPEKMQTTIVAAAGEPLDGAVSLARDFYLELNP